MARGHTAPADLNDARGRMYAVLLRLACREGTAEEFHAIEAHLDALEAFSAQDIEKRMQASVQFFRLISAAAHNQVLSVVAESLNTMMQHAFKSQIMQARQLRPGIDLVNVAVIPL